VTTDREVQQVLEGCAPQVRALAEEARSTVRRIMPIAEEHADPGAGMISYGLLGVGANVCSIVPRDDAIELRFPYGSRLGESAGLLQAGEGDLRYVTIRTLQELGSEQLQRYIAWVFSPNSG